MKLCKACLSEKDRALFPRCARSKDGLNPACKDCCAARTREWRKRNPEAARASEKRWKAANPERVAQMVQASRARNPERRAEVVRQAAKRYKGKNPDLMKAKAAEWARSNPEKCAAKSSARRALQASAMPQWLTDAERAEIRAVYAQCAIMTQLTGIAHHVDHIVPLKGETVCGLHVPWNLRVVTAHVNQTKWRHLSQEDESCTAKAQTN